MIYCIVNDMSYSSSLNIFAVAAGIVLMRGGLKTAGVIRWTALFALSGLIGLVLVFPRRLPIGDSVGEPIFVPRAKNAPEGEGWVLAIVHRAALNRSDLLILNAQDIAGEPEAVLELPCRVPAGFHGIWVGA